MTMRYLVPFDEPGVDSFKQVRPTRGPRLLARWLLVLFFLLALALAFVPWQQNSFGQGQVVAYSPTEREQRIDAPVDGWLQEWFVQEGSRVRQGDPIVRLMDNDPLLLERLQAEQEAVEARVRAAEQALETARRNVARQWALFQEGIASRRQYEEAQLREAEVAKELATAQAELVRIETRVVRQAQQLVTAPQDGIILRRAPGRGSVFVRMGEELAVLVPDTVTRAVELWVDGNDIPLIQIGREVRLQFEGWPAIQISGWPALAVGTFGGRVAVIDPSEAGTPGTFRILVLPMEGERWPDARFLRQGVRAHGWVLLNEVPLGFELWRQFNDFPPALPEPLRQQAQQSGAPDAAKGGTGP